MAEIWDLYHSDGTPAGRTMVRGDKVPEGLRHLACEVLVRHTDGDYLLMHRCATKSVYPDRWEGTAGGSALFGEDTLSCIQRELLEETGITSKHFSRQHRTQLLFCSLPTRLLCCLLINIVIRQPSKVIEIYIRSFHTPIGCSANSFGSH